MPPLDRLKEMEQIFQEVEDKEVDKVLNRFVSPLLSILPIRIYQKLLEWGRKASGARVLFSTLVNFSEGFYEFEGHPVISVNPLFGLYGLISGAKCGSMNITSLYC
jgi:hypothetical protein